MGYSFDVYIGAITAIGLLAWFGFTVGEKLGPMPYFDKRDGQLLVLMTAMMTAAFVVILYTLGTVHEWLSGSRWLT